MEMEVLSTEEASTTFWPADFAAKADMPMINDAYFGPEILLDFKSFPMHDIAGSTPGASPEVSRAGTPNQSRDRL